MGRDFPFTHLFNVSFDTSFCNAGCLQLVQKHDVHNWIRLTMAAKPGEIFFRDTLFSLLALWPRASKPSVRTS